MKDKNKLQKKAGELAVYLASKGKETEIKNDGLNENLIQLDIGSDGIIYLSYIPKEASFEIDCKELKGKSILFDFRDNSEEKIYLKDNKLPSFKQFFYMGHEV